MNPMHVLYFHQHFSTPSGSTGTRSYEMARRLISKGHRVTMVCGSYGGGNSGISSVFVHGVRKGNVDGIDVIEFQLKHSNHDTFLRRTWIFLLFAVRSIWLALTLPYDILFATSTPLTAGIPGIIASIFRRKPFVFESRDLVIEAIRDMGIVRNTLILKAMEILEWTSYHTAVGCVGLSPGIVKGILKRGISQNSIVMIPNGCDLVTFSSEAGGSWRPQGVMTDDFLAIFTGTHGLTNGLEALLDAAAKLKMRGRSDIKIALVGDGKLKPYLIKRADDENLKNCLFLDPIPKIELAALLRGADAGLMILANVPALYYGTSPNKFFDYIAAGLPVVNNYPGWLADLITQNECGIAVEPENPDAFADALVELADKRNLALQMGLNARSLAGREFSRDLLAERFISFIEECASR